MPLVPLSFDDFLVFDSKAYIFLDAAAAFVYDLILYSLRTVDVDTGVL